MKRKLPIAILLMLLISVAGYSQKKMKSPPATAEGTIDGVQVTVNYHQPSARGREIMGGLVPFDKVWRTGANNATTVSFSEDVNVAGEDLEKGKYSLWTIPGEDQWTIIFNSETDVWGTQYNEEADVLRVDVDGVSATDDFVETFTISVEDDAILLTWENTEVSIPITKG